MLCLIHSEIGYKISVYRVRPYLILYIIIEIILKAKTIYL